MAYLVADLEKNSYFNNIFNEKGWFLFTSDLRAVDAFHKTFIKPIHDGNADRRSVAKSQDKGNLDEEKINKIEANDVSLQLDVTTLTYQMKPSLQQLFCKTMKKTIESVEKLITWKIMMMCLQKHLKMQMI